MTSETDKQQNQGKKKQEMKGKLQNETGKCSRRYHKPGARAAQGMQSSADPRNNVVRRHSTRQGAKV
jgi:hypothetical protein